MQSGAMASIVLAVLTLGVGTYFQQQEPPAMARFALITAAKPVEAAAITEEITDELAVAFRAESAPATAAVARMERSAMQGPRPASLPGFRLRLHPGYQP